MTRTSSGMTIGEAARRSGFTVKALRFYERRGLLAPAARRASGYRIYTEVELRRLSFIRQAKALGLTIAGIQPLVTSLGRRDGAGTRAHLARVLGERIQQTTVQLETLAELRRELQRRRRALLRREPGRGTNGDCTCLAASTRPR
jgi:MerR family mercuric resistance operon transcriptional regulator/MerR family gold-responsive transcriptional activator of gol and ges genes